MGHRWSSPEGETVGIAASYELIYPLAFVVVANIYMVDGEAIRTIELHIIK